MRYFCDIIYSNDYREFYEVPKGIDPDEFVQIGRNIKHIQIINVEEHKTYNCDHVDKCQHSTKCVHSAEHLICTECFGKVFKNGSPCQGHYCHEAINRKSFDF